MPIGSVEVLMVAAFGGISFLAGWNWRQRDSIEELQGSVNELDSEVDAIRNRLEEQRDDLRDIRSVVSDVKALSQATHILVRHIAAQDEDFDVDTILDRYHFGDSDLFRND